MRFHLGILQKDIKALQIEKELLHIKNAELETKAKYLEESMLSVSNETKPSFEFKIESFEGNKTQLQEKVVGLVDQIITLKRDLGYSKVYFYLYSLLRVWKLNK